MATRGVKITGLNNLANGSLTGNIIIPVVDPTITIAAPDGETLQSNVNQIANYVLSEAGNLFPEANVAKTVKNNAQPNITSVGTLTSLAVSGNVTVGAELTVIGNISGLNLNTGVVTSNAPQGVAPFVVISNTKVSNLNADLLDGYTTASSDTPSTVVIRDNEGSFSANIITANLVTANILVGKLANGTSNVEVLNNGNVSISVSGNPNVAVFSGLGMAIKGISDLGDIGNVKIYGGANRNVLVTDGLGNLSWGPDIIAAGPNRAIQFNDQGNFGGSANLTFNKNTSTVTTDNIEIDKSLSFIGIAGGRTTFVGANSSNTVQFAVPDTLGTSQQVLGILDQGSQKMGWKTIPVYYITVGMRDGSNYLSSPDPVLRVYPVQQRDGSFLDLNVTQI